MNLPVLSRARQARSAPAARVQCSRLLLASVVLIAGCSSSEPPDDKSASDGIGGGQSDTATSEPEPRADAAVEQVSKQHWSRMVDAGMVRPECPVQDPARLRVVEVNHYNFDGDVQRGRLVVNEDVAESLARIFTTLFEQRFPIEQMTPVEAFDGDTNASLAANNTSAFNCRRADQINAPFADSPHANGRALDINPLQNPWMDLRCDCWLPSAKFQERNERPGGVNKGGLVWRLFRAEGWIWQNIDVADYMHFDTGYPSRPFAGRDIEAD